MYRFFCPAMGSSPLSSLLLRGSLMFFRLPGADLPAQADAEQMSSHNRWRRLERPDLSAPEALDLGGGEAPLEGQEGQGEREPEQRVQRERLRPVDALGEPSDAQERQHGVDHPPADDDAEQPAQGDRRPAGE